MGIRLIGLVVFIRSDIEAQWWAIAPPVFHLKFSVFNPEVSL
ncbi:MAG: hypothetical protein VKK04_20765 [Synechococcales bacterium]|nr:hypothetical protein [Synechococcales bacterium]